MATLLSSHVDALSRIGHALSDGTRARVLLALRTGPESPSVLAERLGVSRQSMSNHLSCLRGCGLVATHADGRTVAYSLADPALADALSNLLDLTRALDPTCCSGSECTC